MPISAGWRYRCIDGRASTAGIFLKPFCNRPVSGIFAGFGGTRRVRDYRLEVYGKETDGGFRTLLVHRFSALDTSEGRTAADIWLSGMKPSLEAASHVTLFVGTGAVCSRPIDRRVWETLG